MVCGATGRELLGDDVQGGCGLGVWWECAVVWIGMCINTTETVTNFCEGLVYF